MLGVFVSGHKFYVCDFRTKHKICILAYHNLCFCVFVFLGMLHSFAFLFLDVNDVAAVVFL